MQMLWRCRHPKEKIVNVYISSKNKEDESFGLDRTMLQTALIVQHGLFNQRVINEFMRSHYNIPLNADEVLTSLFFQIHVANCLEARKSKEDLFGEVEKLIASTTVRGKFIHVDDDTGVCLDMKDTKERIKEEELRNIAEAPVIDKARADEIKKDHQRTDADEYKLKKFETFDFYGIKPEDCTVDFLKDYYYEIQGLKVFSRVWLLEDSAIDLIDNDMLKLMKTDTFINTRMKWDLKIACQQILKAYGFTIENAANYEYNLQNVDDIEINRCLKYCVAMVKGWELPTSVSVGKLIPLLKRVLKYCGKCF